MLAVDAGSEASMGLVPDTCGAGAPSKCRPANAASVIRGVAHFDPAKFAGGPDGGDAVPRLAIFLAHRQYALIPEHALGGHPHADEIMENIDVTKGEIRFAIDLCEHGVAMWTEDNCDFNLILILDKNGNKGPDLTSINMVPDKGELSKMTVVRRPELQQRFRHLQVVNAPKAPRGLRQIFPRMASARSFHTTPTASRKILRLIFDLPAVRSTKTIGTSFTRIPFKIARYVISIWNE
jgi:hypothetical protein